MNKNNEDHGKSNKLHVSQRYTNVKQKGLPIERLFGQQLNKRGLGTEALSVKTDVRWET